MTTVFISYSHKQKDDISILAKRLENIGVDTWFDKHLTQGEWREQLRDKIKNQEVFLFAISAESIASDWCTWELLLATQNHKPIIPILIQPTDEIPEYITQFQMVDMTKDDAFETLGRYLQDASVEEHNIIPIPSELSPEKAPDYAFFVTKSQTATHTGNGNIVQIQDNEGEININPIRLIGVIVALAIIVLIGIYLAVGESFDIADGMRDNGWLPQVFPSYTPSPTATMTPIPTMTPTPLAGQPFADDVFGVLIAQFIDLDEDQSSRVDTLLVNELRSQGVQVIHLDYALNTLEQAQAETDFYNATLTVYGDVGDTVALLEFVLNTDEELSFELDRFTPTSSDINFVADDVDLQADEDEDDTTQETEEDSNSNQQETIEQIIQIEDTRASFSQYLTEGLDIPYFVRLIEAEIAYVNGDYNLANQLYGDAESSLRIQNSSETQIGTLYLNWANTQLRLVNTANDPVMMLDTALENFELAIDEFSNNNNAPRDGFIDEYILVHTNYAKTLLERANRTQDTTEAQGYLDRVIALLNDTDGALSAIVPDATPETMITSEDITSENQIGFGNLYNAVGSAYLALARLDLDPQTNLESAIVEFKKSTAYHTDATAPIEYRLTNFDLGLAYLELADLDIEPEINLQLALETYQETLPTASSLNNLGVIYSRFAGRDIDKTTNTQLALEQFEAAIAFVDPRLNPSLYTLIQTNIAETYLMLEALNDNLSNAIIVYNDALSAIDGDDNATNERIRLRNNLAGLYVRLGRSGIEPETNFNNAINLYNVILGQLSYIDDPQQYALILNQQSVAYIAQAQSGIRPKESLDQALVALTRASGYVENEAYRDSYLLILDNIANTYTLLAESGYILLQTVDDIGNPISFDNTFTRAINTYARAIEITTLEDDPERYVSLHNNMGLLYIRGSKFLENPRTWLNDAIDLYDNLLALPQINPADLPDEYIELQLGRGLAYYELSFQVNNRNNRLNTALESYQVALGLISSEDDPKTYVNAQLGLGHVYRELAEVGRSTFGGGGFDDNIQLAIQTYLSALDLVNPDTEQDELALINANLGTAYLRIAQLRINDSHYNYTQFLARLDVAIELGYTLNDEMMSAMGGAQQTLVDEGLPLPCGFRTVTSNTVNCARSE